jgi:hypothetical protein
MSYLDFHNSIGRYMPKDGLCKCLPNSKRLKLFDPGKNSDGCNWYWGYDGNYWGAPDARRDLVMYEYTPLRENIVLLMAAMNNEL